MPDKSPDALVPNGFSSSSDSLKFGPRNSLDLTSLGKSYLRWNTASFPGGTTMRASGGSIFGFSASSSFADITPTSHSSTLKSAGLCLCAPAKTAQAAAMENKTILSFIDFLGFPSFFIAATL